MSFRPVGLPVQSITEPPEGGIWSLKSFHSPVRRAVFRCPLLGCAGCFMDTPNPSRPWWRRWFGNRAERAAARFLRRQGYRILCQNWSCDFGELDLVTRDGATLVFVEVRSTAQGEMERPAASVDLEKQRRLTKLARAFLKRYHMQEVACRFDVLAISWPARTKEPQIIHFQDAFEAAE